MGASSGGPEAVTVLDASIYASLVVGDTQYEACERTFRALVRKAAPLTLDLSYLTAANILWKHIAVLKRVPEEEWEDRSGLLKDLIYTYSEVHRAEEQLPRALKLALEAHITVYDALYVQLAHSAGSKLLTTDETLSGKLEGTKYGELVRVIRPD